MTGNHRSRIYATYVSGRSSEVAPETLDGLNRRGPYLRRLIERHFPDDRRATIFDFGCGHGALIYFARKGGYTNIRGVDGAAEQVAAAKRLGIEGVAEGDVFETLEALPEGSQDCIVAFDVIEHFTREELIALVDGVRRALKNDGRWIIHVPNGESPWFGAVRWGDLTHELAFTRESIGQLLISSGFKQVRCFEDRPVPHGLKSIVRAALWRMIRIVLLAYVAIETGSVDRQAIFSRNLLAVASLRD